MKQVEILSTQSYDFATYQIDNIKDGVNCTVILRNLNRTPYGVCSVFKYKDVGVTINSPLVNWHNLFFCSNNWGAPPCYEYMNYAVQSGTKTAATVYVSPEEFTQLIHKLPANCHAIPYHGTSEKMSMAYIYRDGTLNELFKFEKVKQIYSLHGIHCIDWYFVEFQFQKPLAYFSDSSQCGFDIQSGNEKKENLIVNGLLLGYPIESTISWIKNDYSYFSESWTNFKIREHFNTSENPYVDMRGKTWLKDGNTIFCDGQQEHLYY